MKHLAEFEELKASKVPSWTMIKDGIKYGYEVIGDARRFFLVKPNEISRTYISDIPDWIQKKIQETDYVEEKALAKAHDHYAIMPENITNELFKKWSNMTIPERLIMLQQTDKMYIEERPGRGGKTYKYVTGTYMVLCANMAFGFNWSSNVQQWETTDKEIICMGYIETKLNNEVIRKYAVGQKDIAFKKDTKEHLCLGDDYKAAEMDMIKKALSFFGIAKDVYSGDVI